MTDAAFRDALEEYRLAFTADKHEPNNGPVPHCAGCDEVRRTRARVLALYAERQGEEYEVAFIQPDCGDPTVPEYAEEWGVGLHGTMPGWLHPGDRVRVTKVEEGQ